MGLRTRTVLTKIEIVGVQGVVLVGVDGFYIGVIRVLQCVHRILKVVFTLCRFI